MNPALGFAIIAGLVLALSIVRSVVWRHQRAFRHIGQEARNAARAAHSPTTILKPRAIREAEDRIATTDVDGNRHLLIRTRTLETVPGPIGFVEVERQQRLTLPGQGHVFAVSDTEFEVFHSRARLRIDVPASNGQGAGVMARTSTAP